MLQLESYQGKMYLKWVFKHFVSDVIPYIMIGVVALALRVSYWFTAAVNRQLATICYIGADIIYVFMLLLFFFSFKRKKAVKPLAYTGRVKRLMTVILLLGAAFTAALFIEIRYNAYLPWYLYMLPNILRYIMGMLLPFFVFLAYAITYPIEEGIKKWYFNDAKKKLAARDDVLKIAITGSFGKTGTKYALATIFNEKYKVLFTPGSFNTPMGVTRVVRGKLKAEHEVFIAEMGARYKGDITELCKLVQPRFGILTSIGKQHLDTFGSLEGVISTKGELMRGLGADGCCFFNGDNEHCRKLFDECELSEKYLFGMAEDNYYMRAENVKTSSEGSEFDLVAADGSRIGVTTVLLGKHNIVNLTGAAALAYRLGLSLDEIAEGIKKAEPVEHRLQLIKGAVTVIDDAYNSNPVGSKEALDALKAFDGRKIIITPGMVELGDEEEALNREFGEHIASCADIAIIIGKTHADPICEGLLSKGFATDCLIRVNSLAEATEKLSLYTEPGCVVLFENDLPDNYSE